MVRRLNGHPAGNLESWLDTVIIAVCAIAHRETTRRHDRFCAGYPKYGFVSAGGGNWYSGALKRLNVGDRLWVKAPGYGFVGVGRVTATVSNYFERHAVTEGPAFPTILPNPHPSGRRKGGPAESGPLQSCRCRPTLDPPYSSSSASISAYRKISVWSAAAPSRWLASPQ